MNEYNKWNEYMFPYDSATCGRCASMHSFGCSDASHREIVAESRALGLRGLIIKAELTSDNDGETHRIFLSFREKFAKFYPEVPRG